VEANLIKYGNVIQLENYIKEHLETVELDVTHHQIPGVYVRAIYIPKDFVLTSKIHKHECINIMAKGLLVVSEGDGTFKRLYPGDIFVSPAGTKRAGYAVEDTVYVTAHHTFETDIETIEDYLACDSIEDYTRYLENLS
jgi:quercetin dioxygenase-like cupin family protein